MPTHDSHCTWCGQHRQAEEDLREAMEILTDVAMTLRGASFYGTADVINRLLARLDERYPK